MDKLQIEKYEAFGVNVSYYRRKRKLTQDQLSEIIGVEPNHMSNIELAKTGASLDVVFRIADALEIPVYKLFEFRD
ncbi:MAG: helix-turn-helix transcriptional regulator [Lawsonibacter sp.]|nr:helix-turn-helix transcriptional regulator [Lawsonibacter sp.]